MTCSQKVAVPVASAVAVAISTYIALYNLFSFDGAFNAQAAINLYKYGTLTLDYRASSTLQTLLPFQMVNGFFFAVFGNTFLAANLANILFYFALFGLFVFLLRACRSLLPLMAFVAMSCSSAFFTYGFGGYGEIPALTYGLLGVSLFVFNRDSTWAYVLGGVFVAFAVTTKWVLFLIVPSTCFVLILLKPGRERLLYFLSAFLFTFIVVCYVQFAYYESGEPRRLVQSMFYQNTPHYGGPYLPEKASSINAYLLRLKEVWEAYSGMSLGLFAQTKIGLSLVMLFVAIGMVFRRRDQLEPTDVLFVFLATFLFVYLAWAFALNSRWYIRRMLISDVLFYLSIGLLPCAARFRQIGKFAVSGILVLFCSLLCLFLSQDIAERGHCSVMAFEGEMRKGLQLLPDDYNAYGNGFLEAPHWSFLAEKKFKDLFRDSVFYQCIENGCHNYLFLDREIDFHQEQRDLLYNTFKLQPIFRFRGFQILKIEGFRKEGKAYVEKIDFSEPEAAQSVTCIHSRTRNRMYRPPEFEFNEMAVFLDNRQGMPLLQVEFVAHKCHEGKNLRVVLLNTGKKEIQDFTVNQGRNRLQVALPERFQRIKMDVYLLLEKNLKNTAPQCRAQNANRIPLEYKNVQLLAESGKSR